MNIGIIDSGSGGMAFAKNLYEKDLTNNYYVILDKSFFPYGRKTKEELTSRIKYLIKSFEIKLDLIILACNTISIMVDKKDLDSTSVICDVVSMTKEYLMRCNYKYTLLLGSYNTVINNPYQSTVALNVEALIEGIQNNNYEAELLKVFEEISLPFDAIILGCTHLIEIKDRFRDYFSCDIISQDELFINKKDNNLIVYIK